MAGHLYDTTVKNNIRAMGFTIVELLIVIVVIGILAAITIVAFNGVTSKARVATVTSDLGNASKKLKIDQVLNGSYPATLAAADNGNGIPASGGTTYQYTVDNSANPPTFCITAVNGSAAYFITDSGLPTSGTCPGDSASGISPPTAVGYYDFTNYDGGSGTMSNVPLPSIPDGSWMIIVVSYTNATDAVPPAGWTNLYGRIDTNTMRTEIFGKIKTSSDPSTFSIGSTGNTTTNGVIFWGSRASSDLSTWIKGSYANRNGTTAQQYITTTPTITTTAPQSLVLSISTERTTVTETDITSLTGATKWFFIPQVGSTKLQTITLSTSTVASPGISSPVTVTYPNVQTLNGMALQIALPPV
jgi:prepilin-type N-terminal cleavage/methylation domain-containing protein